LQLTDKSKLNNTDFSLVVKLSKQKRKVSCIALTLIPFLLNQLAPMRYSQDNHNHVNLVS
jgi:hypothetical protein